ncbi:coproporphyrinogen III oxidase [Alloiococcus sp. CFN-8]|uniref:coproporphyrinogen III oxidase n=1 Tax=Alloiococcus sp. CFN-8 TaxID=3416081 RepID=UPI003CF1B3CF
MKININLNNMAYRYDVYQMFNIYYLMDDIVFNKPENNEDKIYHISICDNSIDIKGPKINTEYYYDKIIGYNNFIKKSLFMYLKEETGQEHPWGTLIGIRPSKIAYDLMKKGFSENDVIEHFSKVYVASEEKARLCMEVARNEATFINEDENCISIYIGMPFCPTRCAYCSFASNPIGSSKKLVEPYLNALIKEINAISDYIDKRGLRIETVYFGGGTPTSISNEEFYSLMNIIHNRFIEGRNIREFTVECGRPDSITIHKLRTMKEFNVDRISINPQTMNDETLRVIGRGHKAQLVKDIFKEARSLGFDNINMDIIVGLQGEGLEEINYTCKEIKKLSPDSVTVHGLSIKRASKIHENIVLNKRYYVPEQKELLEMYSTTKVLSEELEMIPYYMYRQKNMLGNMENIGYTIKGKECIYNIEMIEEKQTIIALGADAISKVVFLEENRIERFGNLKDVLQYTERIETLIEKKIELLDTLYNKL